MRHALVGIVLLLTVSIAFAGNEPITVRDIAFYMAYEFDAVLMDECPYDPDEADVGCYQYPMDTDWHRMRWESFVSRMGDVRWGTPWTQERSIYGRTFLFEGNVYYLYLLPDGSRGSYGLILHFHDGR